MPYTNEIYTQFEHILSAREKCQKCPRTCNLNCADNCLDYQGTIPEYGCKYLRHTYVLKNFCSHKSEVKKALHGCRIEEFLELEGKQKLKVAAVGAGPGTDIFAFLEWFESTGINEYPSLTVTRIDQRDDWNTQYNNLKQIYSELLEHFQIAWKKKIGNFFVGDAFTTNVDLMTFSYVISENQNCPSKRLFALIDGCLSNKAVVVVNDRPETGIRAKVVEVAKYFIERYPNSRLGERTFDPGFADREEIARAFDNHCDTHIPDDLRNKYRSKTTCNSYQCRVFIDKEESQ